MLAILAQDIKSQPELDLWRTYHLGGNEVFGDLYIPAEGGYVICGYSLDRGLIARLDEEGNIEWSTLVNSGRLNSIIQSEAGDFIAGGYSGGYWDGHFSAVRLTSDGEVIWQREYVRPGKCSAVIELKDGSFVLAGQRTLDQMMHTVGHVIRIDGDGEALGRADLLAPGNEQDTCTISSLRETEGGLVFAGLFRSNGWHRPWVVRTDFQINPVWSNILRGELSVWVAGIVSTEGGFVIGTEDAIRVEGRYIRRRPALAKINNDGEIDWQRVHQLPLSMSGNVAGIGKLRDGFTLSGFIAEVDVGWYPFALRTNLNGEFIWMRGFRREIEETGVLDYPNTFSRGIRQVGNQVVIGGHIASRLDGNGLDGLIVRMAPDVLGPEVFYKHPEDSILTVLQEDTIRFIVRARNNHGFEMSYQWTYNSRPVARDTTLLVRFDTLRTDTVICEVTDPNYTVRISWLIHVRNLFIETYVPDSLRLVIQRRREIEFAIEPAYSGDMENLRYEWLHYDSAAVRWEEVGGDDRIGIRSYAFARTGGFALKAKVFDPNVDPVPADSVQWAIQVRGVIRAYEPNLPEISLEPRQEATFELIPFNVNNDSIQFWWTLNEADTLSTQSLLSISFQDTGRFVVSGYARERVGEEEWEEDVQRWAVNVRMLNAEFGMRNEGDLEIEDISLQIAPNPFNDQATVTVDLGGKAFLPALRADKNVRPPRAQVRSLFPVRIGLYAIDGREVLRLHDGPLSPGTHQFRFFTSFRMSSGVYFLRLQTGSHSRTVKTVLLR